MVKYGHLFAFFFLIFTCLVHAETEDQLRKNLQKTKDKTSHLQARLHLLSFLEETNKSSWLKELELIEKQALAYNNPKDQKIISLLLCEKAIYLGAFSNAKLNFERNLKTYIFQSKQLEWRRKLLDYTLAPNKSAKRYSMQVMCLSMCPSCSRSSMTRILNIGKRAWQNVISSWHHATVCWCVHAY
jgi:hypothetical protein